MVVDAIKLPALQRVVQASPLKRLDPQRLGGLNNRVDDKGHMEMWTLVHSERIDP
jgi:hypothetical protein